MSAVLLALKSCIGSSYLLFYCSYTSDKFVVKADGLAAGKGVVIAGSKSDACVAVDNVMVDNVYGKTCGNSIVVEEFLEGFEVSVSKNAILLNHMHYLYQ